MTERAKTLLCNKLTELAGSDREKKLAILDQSILNNWKSVYPLKEQGQSVPFSRGQPRQSCENPQVAIGQRAMAMLKELNAREEMTHEK